MHKILGGDAHQQNAEKDLGTKISTVKYYNKEY
jgi:hypothetical protein